MMYCYNIFDALSARLDTILDEYLHSRKRKFTLLCNRKELQNIKKEFIIAETELAKYANNIRKTKDKLHDVEEKMNNIANNSIEENVDIILGNKTLKKIFMVYDIRDILTKEEAVFWVNNRLSIDDIFNTQYSNLFSFYEIAFELSSKFNDDKTNAIMEKTYIDINAFISRNMHDSNSVIDYINDISEYINERKYLPSQFKETVVNRLKTLSILYTLK